MSFKVAKGSFGCLADSVLMPELLIIPQGLVDIQSGKKKSQTKKKHTNTLTKLVCILLERLFISKNVVLKGKILLKSCNYLYSNHLAAIKRRWNTKGMSPCCKQIIFLSIVGLLNILVRRSAIKPLNAPLCSLLANCE